MDYDEAIRINPTYAIAINNRAVAYYGKGDNDHAVADFDDAIRINPRFASAFQTRGRHFFFEGDFGRASADLLRANDLQDDAYTMLWLYFVRLAAMTVVNFRKKSWRATLFHSSLKVERA